MTQRGPRCALYGPAEGFRAPGGGQEASEAACLDKLCKVHRVEALWTLKGGPEETNGVRGLEALGKPLNDLGAFWTPKKAQNLSKTYQKSLESSFLGLPGPFQAPQNSSESNIFQVRKQCLHHLAKIFCLKSTFRPVKYKVLCFLLKSKPSILHVKIYFSGRKA